MIEANDLKAISEGIQNCLKTAAPGSGFVLVVVPPPSGDLRIKLRCGSSYAPDTTAKLLRLAAEQLEISAGLTRLEGTNEH